MNKLMSQILKFGVVGFIAFFIDFGLYTFICNVLGYHYIIAGIVGFVVSVVVNYVLSMKFVFQKREDTSKARDFTVFVFLSTAGLILNEIILFVCIDLIYDDFDILHLLFTEKEMNVLAKIIATGVVMVYNFVTKKMTLEKK